MTKLKPHRVRAVNSQKALGSNILLKPRVGAGVSGRGAISIASSTRDAMQYPKMGIPRTGGAQIVQVTETHDEGQ